ncbi:MAG: riboflavin biosynthesis protein RibF [Epulopiscium sp. Nuni2H_MBin003]|nr:MAG: riboflavin biosynthesis protein RibF [Epulopiscium sp. Nuni2H_MBin003]
MKYLSHTKKVLQSQQSVIVIGNFDGVHIGHQKLFEVAKQIKERLQIIALSFYPHPSWILSNAPKEIITPTTTKITLMQNLGIDIFVDYPFNLDIANMSAQEFFDEILVKNLGAKKIVVGTDYHFGKKRQANVDDLQKLCDSNDIELHVVKKVLVDDREVSSTSIREFLSKGNIEKVNELLGYNYIISGKVVKGRQIGRQIGFPTANVFAKEGVIYPPNGVYATKIKVYNEEFLAITNIGYNPTLKGEIKTIETNIFEFNRDIYDEEVDIFFYKYIRSEKKFENIQKLTAQILSDTQKVKNLFTL